MAAEAKALRERREKENNMNDHTLLTPEGARYNFTQVLDEMVKRSHLAIEGLTQEQVVEVFRQAIESGDLIRHVRANTPAGQHTQCVIYMPYAEREKLMEQRNHEAWCQAACGAIADTGIELGCEAEPTPAMVSVRKLWEEKEKWRKFATPILDAVKERTGDGCMNEDDQEIMESAAKLGLGNVQAAPYNPDIHGSIDASPGDQIFFWGKSPIPPIDGWQCECGATPDVADGSWRWSGTAWEHHHGHPIGHVPAKRII